MLKNMKWKIKLLFIFILNTLALTTSFGQNDAETAQKIIIPGYTPSNETPAIHKKPPASSKKIPTKRSTPPIKAKINYNLNNLHIDLNSWAAYSKNLATCSVGTFKLIDPAVLQFVHSLKLTP